MKRRVISIATALALSLSLCPTRALAAGAEPDAGLCSHHRGHTEECGYVPGDAGAPCTFVCGVCPVEDLIGTLPDSVTPDNRAQVEDQLNAILGLYADLTADEQDQLDLSRCLALQTQLDAANTPMLLGDDTFKLTTNVSALVSYSVTDTLLYDIAGYTYTAPKFTAFIVQNSGKLYLMGSGTVTSQKGVGVEVLSGGLLSIEDTGLVITGSTYGLKISSGADVQLAGGTFTGGTAAIQADNFDALLMLGCAYFDASGNPLSTADLATAKTVTVKFQPTLSWDDTSLTKDYNGEPVKETDLPAVHITARESDDLSGLLQYSYRKTGDEDFTPGLPTNAGTYEIKASLPQQETYRAAETDPCLTLTIKPLPALVTAPTAISLTYNGAAQQLVTAGETRGGMVIEFAQAQNGPYSTDIPTAVTAGNYDVWYRVTENENYTGRSATKVSSVRIELKTITPTVELSPLTFLYDGGEKEPTVTVKDGQTVVPNTEYSVTYANNRNQGTATVTVTNQPNGNYVIKQVRVPFEITLANQDALSITDKPDTITYGDRFTLGTSGGSGNGNITWKIIGGENTVATVDPNSGQVTVTGVGSATIQATKSGTDNGVTNYEDATAVWTFTAEKRPVTATVTADSKTYDGSKDATVHAVVEQDMISDDEIEIEGLTGTFSDANAGTGKSVTLDFDGARISGKNSDKYIVTYSGTTAKADITKAAANIKNPPTLKALTYKAGERQELVQAGEANIAAIQLEYALNGNGPYSKTIPTGINAGSYEVWYRVPETENYTGTTAEKVDVTIDKQTVRTPASITLTPDSFEYDSMAKEPAVTLYNDNGDLVDSSEYTVAYSNNVNAGTDTAKVTITAKADGNYKFDTATNSAEKTFQITKKQAQVVTPPKVNSLTYSGIAQELVAAGTASGGIMVYSVGNQSSFSEAIPTGIDADEYTVYYKVQGDKNHADSSVGWVKVTIIPKTVNDPVIELSDPDDAQFTANGSYVYDGSPKTPTVVVKDGNTPLTPDTDYNVTYLNNTKAGTATVRITASGSGNYIVNGSKTFEIKRAQAKFTAGNEPTAIAGLAYNATAQPLVNAGDSEDGTVVYSLNGGAYSPVIPTATERGSYTVLAKVEGDSNHEDSEVKTISATIDVNTVTNPTVTLSSSNFTYTGSEQKPTVTVTDNNGKPIPADEYDVTYVGDTINVGTYTIKITGSEVNYSFTATATVTILEAGQAVLSITNKPNVVYYGDLIQLGTTGGSGDGTVTWSVVSGKATPSDSEGQFKITGTGQITVKATRTPAAGSNYAVVEDTWQFYAYPKPVTAVVTAKDKVYDETDKADLTVTIDSRDLVGNDKITISGVTGTFDNENVGNNKTVTIKHDSAKVTGTNNGFYAITYPETTTASITPKAATVTGVNAKTLTYTGKPQPLVTAGTATGGDVGYSLDGVNYTQIIPTGTDVGPYKVWYKALAAENYKDSAPASVEVTISANNVSVTCNPGNFTYDATEKTPTITVTDDSGNIVPASEYDVALPSNRIAAGTYTVTVTDKPGGSYEFASPVTATFDIEPADQAPVTITNMPASVHYGDTFTLGAEGGSGTGAIQWSAEGAATINNGEVTVVGTGTFTVTAYKAADNNYKQSNTGSVSSSADKRLVTATVTAEDKVYDGSPTATVAATVASGLVSGDSIIISDLTGTFDDENVGTGKTVTVNPNSATVTGGNNYEITYSTATASISQAQVEWETKPEPVPNLSAGDSQALVTPGTTKNGIGVIQYRLGDAGDYSTTIPTAADAGEYTVWYRVPDDANDNYTGIAAQSVTVTIQEASSPSSGGSGTGSSSGSGSGSSSSGSISSSQPVSAPSAAGTSIQATVRNGTATASVSAAAGDRLVQEVAANKSSALVVKPEITGDVTKTEVSIPSSTVSRLKNETNADLTVSTPVADVTIPSAALGTLSSTGGTVQVVTEQVDNAVSLALIAGGRNVESVPGGLTLTVPVEDAGPGTVAVLVHNDGTRETIRKAVPENGELSVLLDGPATVEIVDNSKEFADVSSTGWAADAVAFASAHELFNGTSETTFSPDQPMSRGMLATVLYNLEGRPAQNLTSAFSDVSSNAWYAEGVSWAMENGITNGLSGGQFGPDDSVTREQFAVMLWRYAGSPAADGRTLNFTDADQASDYAIEALRWATANGILNGYGNGQLNPGGLATRAEAAQMLKNFMENT